MKKKLVNFANGICIMLVPYNAMYMVVISCILLWELYGKASSLRVVETIVSDLLFTVFGHVAIFTVAALVYFSLKKIRQSLGDEKGVMSWDRGMFAFTLAGAVSFLLIICLLAILSNI